MTLRRILVVATCTTVTACASGAPSTEVVTRDSAGVTIIEYPVGAIEAAASWTAGAPRLRISHGRTSDEDFSWIAGAAQFTDGRIVLIDGQDDGSLIYLYDSTGGFERQIGRVGEGPGEFVSAQLVRAGHLDTLLFQDTRSGRLTWMTRSGGVIKSVEPVRYGTGPTSWTQGELSNGQIILIPYPFSGDPASGTSAFRRPVSLLAFDPDREHLDTLAVAIPGDEVAPTRMDFGGRTRTLNTPIGYGRSSYFAVSSSEVYVAANESSALESYSVPFNLRRSVRFADARHPVDEEARAALKEAALANFGRMGPSAEPMRKQFTEMLERATIADSMPWYQGMTVAHGGAVWLRLGRSASDSVPHYAVIGSDGKLAARADLPWGSRLLWAGPNEVLVARKDADDVERLELRPILKTGAPQ